jgi:uncharacterized membrane protein YphA (DoxX/SURF4 family)
MNTGLLVLRLVAGLLIAGHGIQKVSLWLGGRGLAGGAEEFRRDGFRGGRLTAVAAGAGQIGSGLLLAAGILTPMAALAAMGVMTVAITVKRRNGLWVQNDGYEYPLPCSHHLGARTHRTWPAVCRPWPRADEMASVAACRGDRPGAGQRHPQPAAPAQLTCG